MTGRDQVQALCLEQDVRDRKETQRRGGGGRKEQESKEERRLMDWRGKL